MTQVTKRYHFLRQEAGNEFFAACGRLVTAGEGSQDREIFSAHGNKCGKCQEVLQASARRLLTRRRKPRTVLARVVSNDAEAKGIDWGLGPGVLGQVEVKLHGTEVQQALSLLSAEPEILARFVRIVYSEQPTSSNVLKAPTKPS